MPDTLPNIPLPPGAWVDLYAESGVVVGTRILTQNIGVCDVFLTSQAAEPTVDVAHQIALRGQFAVNDAGDAGAWAFCLAGGLVNVRLA